MYVMAEIYNWKETKKKKSPNMSPKIILFKSNEKL